MASEFLSMFRFPDLNISFSGFLRSAKPDGNGLFSIAARQIYILPSRFGLMFAVLIIAMLIGSINYANNLGFLLTFFLAGVGVIAMIHTWLNLLDIEIQLLPVKPVFAGQQLAIDVRFINHTPRPRGAVELTIAGNNEIVSHDLEAESDRVFTLHTSTDKRGLQHFSHLIISSQFPFGLFNAWCYVRQPIETLVYAKPAAPFALNFTTIASEQDEGSAGEGNDDFHSHRDYVRSDSPSHIDWKVFAREKGLKTKQFTGSQSAELWLSLDLFKNTSLEQAISLLTRAVVDADKNGYKYGLQLPAQTFEPDSGLNHKHRCLKALALFAL